MSTATLNRPASPVSDEQTLRAMISAWSRALEARDVDALLAHYVPDSVLYDVKPPYKLVGVPAIRKVWETCLPYFPNSFKSEHRDLKFIVSNDVAFVFGLHHISVPDEPNHPAGQSWIRVTACFQKIAGQWKVIHEHVSIPFDCTTGQVSAITNPDAF